MARKPKSEPAIPSFGDLSEKKLRSLGQKLDKLLDANGFKHGNLLRKQEGDAQELVWHLARHGLVLQEVISAGILRELSEYIPASVSAADVLTVLRRLPPDLGVLDRGAAAGWAMLTPGMLFQVDALVVHAYCRDAAALLAARAELSPNLQLAVDFVHRRAGEAISPESAAIIHQHLVSQHCAHGLALNIDVPRFVAGVRTEHRLANTREVIALAGLFAPPHAWGEAVLAWLLPRVATFRGEADGLSERAHAGLVLASLPDLLFLFGDGWWNPASLLRVLDARAERPAALFAAAARLCAEGTAPFRGATPQVQDKKAPPLREDEDDDEDEGHDDYDDYGGDDDDESGDDGDGGEPEIEDAPGDHERVRGLATVLTVVGIERALAAGEAVPETVDAAIDLRRVFASDAPFVLRLRAAVAALGPRRAHALTRALLAEQFYFGKAIATCDLCLDPALVEEVVARIDAGDYAVESDLLGLCSLAVVPAVAARAAAQADPKKAERWWEGILAVLARASAAGETWPPELDRHIRLDHVAFSYGASKVDPVLAMLRRLPLARYGKVIAANTERCAAEPWRLVRALRPDAPAELLERVFAALAARPASIKSGTLGEGLRALGGSIVAPMLRAFADTPAENTMMREIERALAPEAFAEFTARLGKAIETPSEELRRLAASAPGPKVRIYLLARGAGEVRADTVARIGGRPRGVSDAATPAFRGEPMTHMLTLDLEALPELAARHPGARSVSLYLPDPDGGAHHRSGALVWTPAAGLASAPGSTSGASPLVAEAFDVPAQIFAGGERDATLERVRSIVYRSHGYVGGGPLWLQDGPEGLDPGFLLQFDEGLCSLNLGDMGVMYVFDGHITWQCH